MPCTTADTALPSTGTLHGMDTEQLHALVYRRLLPELVQREGRERAEARILRFKVLGGLGPAATADFLLELLDAVPAARDREHLRLDVKIDPLMGQLPDATPLPATQEALDALLGSDTPTVFCLPCNTAHWRIGHLRFDREQVAFVSMVDATVAAVAQSLPRGGRVGLLATSRMAASGLYQQAFAAAGFTALTPSPAGQRLVDLAIYGGEHGGVSHAGVKGGECGPSATALVQAAVDELTRAHGAGAITLSCTELPLVFGPQRGGPSRGNSHGLPVVNSTRALARAFAMEALRRQAECLLRALN